MKLLFDENLSYKLVGLLALSFPTSQHVRNCGLENELDYKIRDFAKENNFIIVTKDNDFLHLAEKFGAPPKIILIKTGNCDNMFLKNLIESSKSLIQLFELDEFAEILIIE